MSDLQKPILIIVGPTAIGKSDFAIKIAKDINGEIINADSRLVYKNFNIGTAKPNDLELKRVKHHLINILNPDRDFNISQFLDLVKEKTDQIIKSKKTPIIVGGTGQYIKAILNDWTISKVPPNKKLREEIEKKIKLHGPNFAYKFLQEISPLKSKQIDPSNQRRIIRAIEISQSEKPNSISNPMFKSYSKITIGLTTERKILYSKIDKRVDQMINEGWIDEVKFLINKNINLNHPAMSSVGYKEIFEYLTKNQTSLEEVIQKIKFRTHKLVRTQYNWFKLSDEKIKWFQTSKNELDEAKNFILSKFN
ncbi:MAG: tRNA (adenosine(37)-N6)-dimethylallyltransferase MiaA [SAR202 cluster bacterium]|nr:tRNA (adenosine(37)-N6)-dimethylallyltransferase MiaA [SAR202 cluster bacterium]|tara:strand:+ start:31348 stop:32271 length:924 start_codon:yes stop_codon:yes gene_type:complete